MEIRKSLTTAYDLDRNATDPRTGDVVAIHTNHPGLPGMPARPGPGWRCGGSLRDAWLRPGRTGADAFGDVLG